MGIHTIDLVLSLFGGITNVSAYTDTIINPIKVEDNASLLFKTEGGVIGTIDVSWTSQPYIGGIEVYGTNGSMLVDYGRDAVLLYCKEEKGKYAKGWKEIPERWGNPYENEMRNFVGAVSGQTSDYPTGEDGVRSLGVALAVYESSRLGRTIRIKG